MMGPGVGYSVSVATCSDSGTLPQTAWVGRLLYRWSCQPTYANVAMSSTPNEMPTPNPIAKELFDLSPGLAADCPWFVVAPVEVVAGFVPVVRAVVGFETSDEDVVEMPLHTAALISGT